MEVSPLYEASDHLEKIIAFDPLSVGTVGSEYSMWISEANGVAITRNYASSRCRCEKRISRIELIVITKHYARLLLRSTRHQQQTKLIFNFGIFDGPWVMNLITSRRLNKAVESMTENARTEKEWKLASNCIKLRRISLAYTNNQPMVQL